MKKIFTLSAMLLVFVANVLAEEVTIDFTAKGYENGQEITSVEQDGITITFDKGTNSNNPKYYNTGTAIRLYGGNSMKVAVSGKLITQITFTFDSGESTNEISASIGTFTSPTWTGSGEEVTFNVGGTTGHRRVQKMVITLSASSDTRTSTSISLATGYKTKFTYGPDGESFDLPAATVMAGSTPVPGATVTWTVEKVSGNDALAPTISGNKVLIPRYSYGQVKVTASYAGNTTYRESSTNYTVNVYKGRTNLRELLEDFANKGDKDWNGGIPTSYWQINLDESDNITPINATVTYVNGAYTYIKDANNYCMLLYKNGGIGFEKGDVINGVDGEDINAIYGNVKTYNGLLEMEVTENNFNKVSSGTEVTPETIDITTLGEVANMNRYLKVEKAIYLGSPSTRNYTFKVGDAEFIVRQNWTNVSVDDLEENGVYTLEGMGAMFNDTPQLYLISFEKTGDATGIETMTTTDANDNAPKFNLAGQQVNDNYKGVVVQKGKKHIAR